MRTSGIASGDDTTVVIVALNTEYDQLILLLEFKYGGDRDEREGLGCVRQLPRSSRLLPKH